MSGLPESADGFYALRDDRTNRCVAGAAYQGVSCAISVSSASASTIVGQTILVVAANLLSRWCRRVTIVVSPTQVAPDLRMGRGDLGDLVIAQMRAADPFGAFEVVERAPVPADLVLAIGSDATAMSGQPAVFVQASGWLASVARERAIELEPTADGNLLGAMAAACLGVAQLFKIAVGQPTTSLLRDGVFDVFRLEWSQDLRQAAWPSDLSVGRILMVGAGSVGSSAAYCMRFARLVGALTVVDRDLVKVENFNRSPLFDRASLGLAKGEAVVKFLAGSRLVTTSVQVWWNDFIRQHPRSSLDFDVWLPLANEFDVRLAMQRNVPPLMIHASTTNNWGVNHGRHVPGRDDCLADRFPSVVSADVFACSTGKVTTADTVIDAALPFASFFAGILIAADLVRAQLPEYPQVPNFALFDWYGPLDLIQSWDRKPRDGCICREQGRGFHDKFNAGTKYRPVFRL